MVDRNCVKPYTIYPENKDEKILHIEKGVNILIPIYGIHRDPKYFPNPEIFDPERFSDERKDEVKPFSLLPFGLGPRGCIGNFFLSKMKYQSNLNQIFKVPDLQF